MYTSTTDGEIEDLKRKIGDTVLQIKQDSMFISVMWLVIVSSHAGLLVTTNNLYIQFEISERDGERVRGREGERVREREREREKGMGREKQRPIECHVQAEE